MALDEDLAERMRAVLAGTGSVREVRMFGGLCFMLNGNMVAGTSKRGLLVRVGKDQQSNALARPGAKLMEMTGRSMEGYIFVDPPPARRSSIAELACARRCLCEDLAAQAGEIEAPACQEVHGLIFLLQ
jgi:hypothetical protein